MHPCLGQLSSHGRGSRVIPNVRRMAIRSRDWQYVHEPGGCLKQISNGQRQVRHDLNQIVNDVLQVVKEAHAGWERGEARRGEVRRVVACRGMAWHGC